MPVLFLLEPGVVIYKMSFSQPSLPISARGLEISKYQFTAALGHIAMSHLYTLLSINHVQAPGLAESCFLFGNLVRKREREVTDFSFPGRGRPGNLTWTHITSHQINKIWSSHPAQLIAEEINRLLDQKSEAWIQTNQYLSSSSYICKMEVSLWSHTRYKGFWKE